MSELTCPACDVVITGMIGNTDTTPGGPVICVSCRALVIFTDDGLRLPTEAEMDHLLTQPAVVDSIRVVAEFHRQHGAPKAG